MFAADLLSLCCVLWASPRAQEPTTTAPDRALLRATADLRRVTAVTAAQDHTFAGRCMLPPDRTAVTFTIARRADLDWLRLGKHVVVNLGSVQLVQDETPAWRPPQGEAPDLPLLPLALLHHSATGVLQRCEPCSHSDRPAQRAVLRWSGTAARRLIEQVSVPCAHAQPLLERFETLVEDPTVAKNLLVDAAIVYDPSSHTLFACSLRITMFQQDTERTAEDPDPPAGLTPLAERIAFQFGFELTRIDAPPVAWPELSADDRRKLIAATRR